MILEDRTLSEGSVRLGEGYGRGVIEAKGQSLETLFSMGFGTLLTVDRSK